MMRQDDTAGSAEGMAKPSQERRTDLAGTAAVILTHSLRIIALARAVHWAWEWMTQHLSSEG